MKIDHERLKKTRADRGLTAKKLADKLEITPKTIQRWENPKKDSLPLTIPKGRASKLAKALDVETGVLTGDLPMPDLKPLRPEAKRLRIGADVSSRTHNAYIIAKKRYGYSQTEIIEMAPLLLAIIAEGSLDFRRKNLEQVNTNPNSLGLIETDEDNECFEQEEDSIKKNDLFGELVTPEGSKVSYYPPTGNPFTSYMYSIVNALTNKEAVHLDEEYEASFVKGIPDYTTFLDDARKLAGGDELLAQEIAMGIIKLKKMPDNLWPEDAIDRRVDWLRKEKERKNRELEELKKEAAQSTDNSFIDPFLGDDGEENK